MTTAYSFSDTLPKDLGGQKLGAVAVDDSTSQNDFVIHRGIAATPFGSGSIRIAHLAVGSHTVGSAVGAAGMLAMAAYTEAPSAIGPGNAQRLRVDKQGALYIRGASALKSVTTASTQTHVVGSALLHGYNVVLSNVNLGNTITINDGTTYAIGEVATAASQSISVEFTQPVLFTTSLRTTRSLGGAGAASITLFYSQY